MHKIIFTPHVPSVPKFVTHQTEPSWVLSQGKYHYAIIQPTFTCTSAAG